LIILQIRHTFSIPYQELRQETGLFHVFNVFGGMAPKVRQHRWSFNHKSKAPTTNIYKKPQVRSCLFADSYLAEIWLCYILIYVNHIFLVTQFCKCLHINLLFLFLYTNTLYHIFSNFDYIQLIKKLCCYCCSWINIYLFRSRS